MYKYPHDWRLIGVVETTISFKSHSTDRYIGITGKPRSVFLSTEELFGKLSIDGRGRHKFIIDFWGGVKFR